MKRDKTKYIAPTAQKIFFDSGDVITESGFLETGVPWDEQWN